MTQSIKVEIKTERYGDWETQQVAWLPAVPQIGSDIFLHHGYIGQVKEVRYDIGLGGGFDISIHCSKG